MGNNASSSNGESRSEDEEKSPPAPKPAQDSDLEATQALIARLLREQREPAQRRAERQQERQQQVLRNIRISDRQAEVWRGIMQITCQACGYRYTKNAAGETQFGRCGASDLQATQALIARLLREQRESSQRRAERQQERQQQVLRNISGRQAEVWRGIMQSTCQACGYRYTKNAAGETQCGRCGASRSEDEEKSRDEKPAQDSDLEATPALIAQLLREQKES